MVESSLDPKLRNRLTRFLHTGNELPKYYPGCWTSHKYFEADKLTAINEALERAPNNVEVVNIILKLSSPYQDMKQERPKPTFVVENIPVPEWIAEFLHIIIIQQECEADNA